MASKHDSITEDGIYFAPRDKVEEALKWREFFIRNEKNQVEQDGQRGYKTYESTISNFSDVSEVEDEYVLEDISTIQPQPQVSSIQTRRPDEDGIYDENHYSIANPRNCVTQRAGVLVEMSEHKPVTKGNTRWVTKKCLKVVGFFIGLICLGGISGIVVTLFSGIISINFSKNRFLLPNIKQKFIQSANK